GIISALLISGASFACLFVPLNTTALANIPRHLLADATGLNSLFRQFGGSIGLAIFANLLSRYSIEGKASVAAHISMLNPEALTRLSLMKASMIAHGYDSVAAQSLSLRFLQFSATAQGTVLAFEKLFLLQGIAFLMVLPLLFFLKTNPVASNTK